MQHQKCSYKTFAVNANGAKNKNFPPEFIWIHYVSPPLLLMKKDKESDVKILQPASHSTPQITVYSRTVSSYHLLLTLLIQVKPTKTIAENWISKQSWFVFILKPAHFWLRSYFFRNKTFLFFKIDHWNFQHLFSKGISWNLTKFQLNQTTNKKRWK